MTEAEHDGYIEEHICFEKPVSPLLIASRMDSHWPHGRGMYFTTAKNFIVWANEEDHLRIVSMEEGSDMVKTFRRWCDGINKLEKLFKDAGYE